MASHCRWSPSPISPTLRRTNAGRDSWHGAADGEWDLCWQVVEIDTDDVPNLRYANMPEWAALSRGTLLPSVGAKRIGEGDPTIASEAHVDAITGIAPRIRNGETLPPAIAMGTPSGTLIVFVEGHARITAHLLADVPNPFRLIYGSAPLPRLRSWLFFPPDAS